MGVAKPFEKTLFPRHDGRLSVFATGMMAEEVGLTSNVLQIGLLSTY